MKHSNKPLVSVIMPAYNAEKTISCSIDSILKQTYHHIELIVVDDGSKDGTASIIKSYSDSRVKYYKNEHNIGLVKTLNRAISLANGDYVARMDSDDISLPDRINQQVDYMESHKDCIICGTFAKSFIESGGTKKICGVMKYEIADNKIKNDLAYECCFAHPTVMFRSKLFSLTEKRYNDDYLNSEDYNYWIDLMDFGEYHNIPQYLLLYRISSTQMSASSEITFKNSSRCRLNYIEKQYGKDVLEMVMASTPSIALIRQMKDCGIDNNFLYKLFYLSLKKYRISDFLYYLYSGDVFKQNLRTSLQLLKRVVIKPAPIFGY